MRLVVRGVLPAVLTAWALPLRAQAPAPPVDPVQVLVSRLDLESYKATLRALTRFGDRRQGTGRNRAALDWIEAQLTSYGCAAERFNYDYQPPAPRADSAAPVAPAPPAPPRLPVIASGEVRRGPGGSRLRGIAQPTGVNSDSLAQADPVLRQLNAEPSTPGPRQQVYCTKVGATRPQEMYIVGAHMDGIGWGEAADDNGSGTALVLEVARVLNRPDVRTDRSVRFILWNNEETGLHGARAYVEARAGLQGKEDPPGSGLYPEPRWLGMIQHDMMLFDHGMRREDGGVPPDQRPEADVNIEFQSRSLRADDAAKLAFLFKDANERYATDHPAVVGSHMTNTDSWPFMDFTAAISLRENERGMHVGAGWNPHWHQPTDRFATYSDADFRLGLNAAQTTLAAVAQLVNATLAP
jgi:hypothetical protein